MWELDYKESWAQNWCFWTVVLEKTLESPLDCERSNQSILKEIFPGCSLEGLMLKLKLQYFGHLMWRADSFERTLMLGKMKVGGEGDDRGWNDWMASLSQWTWVWVNSGSWWWIGRPGVLQFMGSQRVGHDWATELNCTAGRYDKEQNLYFFCKELDLIAFPISHGRGRSQKEREELEVCL